LKYFLDSRGQQFDDLKKISAFRPALRSREEAEWIFWNPWDYGKLSRPER
jgi:hypothetical protein